jgi:hypothetical protein
MCHFHNLCRGKCKNKKVYRDLLNAHFEHHTPHQSNHRKLGCVMWYYSCSALQHHWGPRSSQLFTLFWCVIFWCVMFKVVLVGNINHDCGWCSQNPSLRVADLKIDPNETYRAEWDLQDLLRLFFKNWLCLTVNCRILSWKQWLLRSWVLLTRVGYARLANCVQLSWVILSHNWQ